MKKYIAITFFLLYGCMSGPRPYDGVIGYRLEPQPTGLQVTYIDEAKVSHNRTLADIANVCSAKLNSIVPKTSVKVLSESASEQQVSMSISIPVGVESSGNQRQGNAHRAGDIVLNSISQTQAVVRTMKLRKTVALCAPAS